MALIEVPSPTCSAGAVADQLASLLQDDGFEVERPVANWPEAPVVVVRFATDQPGRGRALRPHQPDHPLQVSRP